MAASDPTWGVPTPTGTLQGVAACNWDGITWAGSAGPGMATPTGVLRGVAPFSWDGTAWQPAGLAGPGVATPSGVLEGVAVYTWSGSAWVPAGGQPSPSTSSGALRGVAVFNWDGAAWQPAGRAGPSVATPYGVLDGVAMFHWTGSAWTAINTPSLDLSFMTPGTLPPNVSCTRASVASYFDATGTLQTAAANQPRWDYDPVTHVLNGLLIEGPRTNWLVNSAVLVTQNVGVSAQAYTLSFYGTGTVVLSGTATGTLVGVGAFPARATMTFTPTAGTLTLTVTGSVLNAQLENATYASSWIPTTGAALARQLDDVKMPTGAWFNPVASTLLAEYLIAQSPNPVAGVNRDVCGITDGTTSNRLILRGQSGSGSGSVAQGFMFISGSSQFAAIVGSVTGGVPAKLGVSWDGSGAISAFNGGAAQTSVATGMPAGLNVVTFGNEVAALIAPVYGWFRRFQYWPRALGAYELQSVTT